VQVQGVVAEYEREKIVERCRRGKLHLARRGAVSVLGAAPYGYRYVPATGRRVAPGAVQRFNWKRRRWCAIFSNGSASNA